MPITLLIRPAFGLFMYVLRIIVAFGYEVSDYAQRYTLVPTNLEEPGAAVYAQAEAGSCDGTFFVQLPTGELFVGETGQALASNADKTAADARAADATNAIACWNASAPGPTATIVVKLDGSKGGTMHCDLDPAAGGSCRTDLGETFDLVL
jgi:hypothetical protein